MASALAPRRSSAFPTTQFVQLAQKVLRVSPTVGKYLVLLLFLLNAGSWPLVWHLRVFHSLTEARCALACLRLKNIFSGRKRTKAALEAWYESRMPLGAHPFRSRWDYTRRVWLDDGDFNMHMSNSSYAKALDSARLRLAIATFPTLFRSGGWCALAATHFHFIREIPIFARYEIRVSIGAWDGKWIWVVARFVRPPSKSKKSKFTPETGHSAPETSTLIPTLKTPATPLTNGAGTPANGNANGSPNENESPEAIAGALLARAAAQDEEDGALLYTIVVSQLCFKHGRISVPPAVVLAANGFHASADNAHTTRVNPRTGDTAAPPHWPAVRALTADLRALAAFYRGGWREVPPESRWWEHAFAPCEAERRERLVPFVGAASAHSSTTANANGGSSGLSGGLEGVRRLG
ncbi:hypothetical protein DFH07DRAFT_925202 [Mycena maculata]|uniref:Thioesterase/thiol ester dehydrase-isomerase n=1 Tax=Mycena maculata TaxID=230809 RepID=A0AAD7IIP0_9AGAR|nr:hypothetical protein DFH07DRAFT_925202 [Mycena maculata]